MAQPFEHLFGGRYDQFGGFARGRRADVGRQVGERDVDLVADRRNDNRLRRGDRPNHRLLVERPEVFEAAAAAGHHDAVDRLGEPVDQANRLGNLLGGPFALHPDGHDQHVRRPPSPAEHLEKVADGRPGRAGDHGDPPDEPRQRPLPLDGEQTLA